METSSANKCVKQNRRTWLLGVGLLILSYPVLRFVGYKLPKKPEYIKINKSIQGVGHLVTNNFVLFDRNDKSWALSRKCTHLGCKLNYHEEFDYLECPCHQSRFHTETGKVIRGPAKRGLTFYPVEKRPDEPKYVVTT